MRMLPAFLQGFDFLIGQFLVLGRVTFRIATTFDRAQDTFGTIPEFVSNAFDTVPDFMHEFFGGF